MEKYSLETRIMHRIYTVHLLRRLARPFGLRAWLLFIAAAPLFFFVSLREVFQNAAGVSGASGFYTFAQSAVVNTELVVQLGLLGLLIFAVLTLRDLLPRQLRLVS